MTVIRQSLHRRVAQDPPGRVTSDLAANSTRRDEPSQGLPASISRPLSLQRRLSLRDTSSQASPRDPFGNRLSLFSPEKTSSHQPPRDSEAPQHSAEPVVALAERLAGLVGKRIDLVEKTQQIQPAPTHQGAQRITDQNHSRRTDLGGESAQKGEALTTPLAVTDDFLDAALDLVTDKTFLSKHSLDDPTWYRVSNHIYNLLDNPAGQQHVNVVQALIETNGNPQALVLKLAQVFPIKNILGGVKPRSSASVSPHERLIPSEFASQVEAYLNQAFEGTPAEKKAVRSSLSALDGKLSSVPLPVLKAASNPYLSPKQFVEDIVRSNPAQYTHSI